MLMLVGALGCRQADLWINVTNRCSEGRSLRAYGVFLSEAASDKLPGPAGQRRIILETDESERITASTFGITIGNPEVKKLSGEALLVVEELDSSGCIVCRGDTTLALSDLTGKSAAVALKPELPVSCRVEVHLTGAGSGALLTSPEPQGREWLCRPEKSTCSARFPQDQPVVLTAQPAAGSHAGGWSEGCTSRSPGCTLAKLSTPIKARLQLTAGVCTAAGFCWENPLPQGNNLSGMWASPDDGALVLVGARGTLLLRRDLGIGGGWQSFPGITAQDVHGVSGASASEIWAVGAGGFTARFDGTRWAQAEVPSGSPAPLYSVYADPPHGAWAVGESPESDTLLNWNGTSWVKIAANSGGAIFTRIWGRSATSIYATGTLRGTAALANWNGTAWSAQTNVCGASVPLRGLWGDEGSLWLLSAAGEILRYTPSGCSSEGRTPDRQALSGIWGRGSQVFAVGDGGRIMRREGAQWQPEQSPTSTALRTVWVGGSSEAWAAGDAGVILVRRGDRWQLESDTPRGHLRAIAGSGPDRLWAVGDQGLILRWDGARWLREASPDPRDLSSVAVHAGGVWATGDGGLVLHRGPEEGDSWTRFESPHTVADPATPFSKRLTAVAVSDSNLFVAGEDGMVFRTRLQGPARWIDIPIWGLANTVRALWVSGTSVFAAFESRNGTSANLARSDGGTIDWIQERTGTSASLYALWGTAPDDLWAAGDGVITHRTKDNRDSWQVAVSSPGVSFRGGVSLKKSIFAIGTAGTIWRSDGSQWRELPSVASSDLLGIWGADPDELVVVGEHGSVLRSFPYQALSGARQSLI